MLAVVMRHDVLQQPISSGLAVFPTGSFRYHHSVIPILIVLDSRGMTITSPRGRLGSESPICEAMNGCMIATRLLNKASHMRMWNILMLLADVSQLGLISQEKIDALIPSHSQEVIYRMSDLRLQYLEVRQRLNAGLVRKVAPRKCLVGGPSVLCVTWWFPLQ